MALNVNNDDVFLGTELKININISPIGTINMDSYDFEAEFYCSAKKSIVIDKKQAIRIDENNYVFLVDTNELGSGSLKCKITAQIPDADFDDMLRTEVKKIETGINVIKNL